MSKADDLIKEEINAILRDIKAAYESSGRKVTGEFAKGLEAVYEPNKATIKGFVYLAGRGKTKDSTKGNPTVLEQIREWVRNSGVGAKILAKQESKPKTAKGLKNFYNGLAYTITRKIHAEGTNREDWLNIYEQVITGKRIKSIIDKVAVLNVNRVVSEINIELEILTKNV